MLVKDRGATRRFLMEWVCVGGSPSETKKTRRGCLTTHPHPQPPDERSVYNIILRSIIHISKKKSKNWYSLTIFQYFVNCNGLNVSKIFSKDVLMLRDNEMLECMKTCREIGALAQVLFE